MTGIIRFAILALLAWLAWQALRRLLGRTEARPPLDRPTRMLRCETCGVHVPETEAFTARGHTFCSQAHQQQWLAQHDR